MKLLLRRQHKDRWTLGNFLVTKKKEKERKKKAKERGLNSPLFCYAFTGSSSRS
jgi:hypothetical protein